MRPTLDLAPRAKADIERFSDFCNLILRGRGAYYLSTPLTSGRRRLIALRNLPPTTTLSSEAQHQLMNENREAAKRLVTRLACNISEPIISPAFLPDFDGWGQEDYHAFWSRIIAEHDCSLIFADDWQYSTGCAWEFYTACVLRRACFDEQRNQIGFEKGAELITAAVNDWNRDIGASELLAKVQSALQAETCHLSAAIP